MNLSTPTQQTPVYDLLRQTGAQLALTAGWHEAQLYTSTAAEVAAARQGVALVDESSNGKLLVEGRQAREVVSQGLGAPDLAVGAGWLSDPARVYRLRPDLFFVGTSPGRESATLAALAGQRGERFVTLTDITHGRTEFRLVGPAVPQLLSKLCGLDFAAFSDNSAKQTSAAKTGQLLIRRDLGALPAFSLVGARSLGAYVWQVLLQAGREWSIVPMGKQALQAIVGSRQ